MACQTENGPGGAANTVSGEGRSAENLARRAKTERRTPAPRAGVGSRRAATARIGLNKPRTHK